MPKAIAAVAQWLATGNGFDRLSSDDRRAAWSRVLLTHIALLPVTYVAVYLAQALRPTVRNYLITHFIIALLLAKLAEGAAGIYELIVHEKPRFETNGWFFAFSITLVPLLAVSLLVWAL
jgi:hypothetical protein